MPVLHLSSGDLIADRRASYAAMLAQEGDHAAAADLMEQALDLAPDWPVGWCLLGDYRAEAGDRPGAVAAYRELVRLDQAGIFGGVLKLAALGAAPPPQGTDVAYVESLFDDYAERFEAELVLGLDYEAPARLAALIAAVLGERVPYALDLGCGTGLMGERLRGHALHMEGVDLSASMVEMAARKGIYDRLHKAELTAFLSDQAGTPDLVAAADVLNYCGALPPVLTAVAARLAPGGLFAFTLERHDGVEPMRLRPSLRYAHSEAATRAAAVAAGFEIVALETAALRQDRGRPVAGLLVLLRKLPLVPRLVLAASQSHAGDAAVPVWDEDEPTAA